VTASEYLQFGDDVVVSAITRQWIVVDQQLDFVTCIESRCVKETDDTPITLSIQHIHK